MTLSLITQAIIVCLNIVLIVPFAYSSDLSNPLNKDNNDTLLTGLLVVKNKFADIALPIANIPYQTISDSLITKSMTSTGGSFKYQKGDKITFQLGAVRIGPMEAKITISQLDFIQQLCAINRSCQHNTQQNLVRTFASMDVDHDASNGYYIQKIERLKIDFTLPVEPFERLLRKKLRKEGITLTTTFVPSLGINLEEPQPENDTVGGQALAFVDLFRIARPFKEYSCPDITYDLHGWPIRIPPSCANQKSLLKQAATTSMLRYVPADAIPSGNYTVIYEGDGVIEYSGIAKLVRHRKHQDTIHLSVNKSSDLQQAAGLRLRILKTNPSNPVRNIRVVMPGGICKDDIFTRISHAKLCKGSSFISFASQLRKNRNTIIFNPDFLRELRNFKVFRTMNFMKASPSAACKGKVGENYQHCLLKPFTWKDRPTLDDAVWGGSAKTPIEQRYGKGVPLEVIVKLANLTQSDPWFNIVHSADDDYIKHFARYVEKHLDYHLKTYIEYTNEAWNGSFWAAHYVQQMGLNQQLHKEKKHAGRRYYSKRATDIFKIWAKIFDYDNERYVRVLGGHQTNPILSAQMLKQRLPNRRQVKHYVDALAIGTYFYGCWNRRVKPCQNRIKVPKTLSESRSIKDVFDIVTNPYDPYSLPSLFRQIKQQMRIAKRYNVHLISYEGGQHIVVNWNDHQLFRNQKMQLTQLFAKVNRDPQMGKLYSQLFKRWKKSGGTLMTLYTLPQSYHRWGSWGLKEHLNKPRSESPKYDAAMRFMEEQDSCWWERCL